ncbi:MAG: OprO/OprP family phosphate-selective porin [Chromatiales bacterium]
MAASSSIHRSLSVLIPLLLVNIPAAATDEALLQVLLANKLITAEQYEAIKKAEAPKPAAAPAQTTAGKPLPTDDQGLLDVLLANGVISQQQFAALQVKNADEKARKQEAKEGKVTLREGYKVTSPDKDFSAQVGARAELDAAFYNDDKTDFSDGTEMRRVRLTVNGTVFKDWDYKAEADFAGATQGGSTNNVTVTDAFLRYNGLQPLSFTAGNFKVPFGLEAVSSGKYTTFMERGLPFAFLNLRLLGGMASTNGDNWSAAVGLFGDSVTAQGNDDEGKGVAGRVTWAPFARKDRVLHVGLGGQWREPGQVATGTKRKTLRFRSRPESNIINDALEESSAITAGNKKFGRSSGRLVDTGSIDGDVDHHTLFGGELALVFGPLSLQGEYIRADVSRETGGDLAFDGYYVYGSWFLTGESRNYKADKGVFDILYPNEPFNLRGGGPGAWELGLRFSSIDLSDENIDGGEEQNVTAGLNWYPNAFVRLMANYVKVLEVDGGAHNDEDLDVFQVRAQVAY